MRLSLKRLLAAFGATTVLVTAGIVAVAAPASAEMYPSFKVTCYPTGIAQNDPIVFPGQAGRSHMHTFYGAHGVDQNTTVASLLSQPTSQCGSHFDGVDRSAYWIPALYQNGQAVYSDTGSQELRAYYQRAGGASGAPVAQAFPQGLRMIAGDMHATTPQSHVSYVCAKTTDPGTQRGGTSEFLTCNSDETVVAKLVFPDCWNGVDLDSPDHKSHMAYSDSSGNCPADHPVKLPQMTFEAWYWGTNGDASSFSWASGGPYSFHGDVISAWDPHAAANLVDQCINVAYDCNPLMYEAIPQGSVDQSQIDAQLTGSMPAATSSGTDMSNMPGMTMPTTTPTTPATPASPTTAPTATPTPTPVPATPDPTTPATTEPPTSAPIASAPSGSKPSTWRPTVPSSHVDMRAWWHTFGIALGMLLRHWGFHF